jgi:hypothetical protein
MDLDSGNLLHRSEIELLEFRRDPRAISDRNHHHRLRIEIFLRHALNIGGTDRIDLLRQTEPPRPSETITEHRGIAAWLLWLHRAWSLCHSG